MKRFRRAWKYVALLWIGMFVSCYLVIPFLQSRMPNERFDHPAVFALKCLVPFTLYVALLTWVNHVRLEVPDSKDAIRGRDLEELK
jgi:hypothetical protein